MTGLDQFTLACVKGSFAREEGVVHDSRAVPAFASGSFEALVVGVEDLVRELGMGDQVEAGRAGAHVGDIAVVARDPLEEVVAFPARDSEASQGAERPGPRWPRHCAVGV
jgi:hypothetical protein